MCIVSPQTFTARSTILIKFVEGVIGSPQPTDSIVKPENVEFLGQKINLNPFKGLLKSVQDGFIGCKKTSHHRSSTSPEKQSLGCSPLISMRNSAYRGGCWWCLCVHKGRQSFLVTASSANSRSFYNWSVSTASMALFTTMLQ